jgi:hypothetical protein
MSDQLHTNLCQSLTMKQFKVIKKYLKSWLLFKLLCNSSIFCLCDSITVETRAKVSQSISIIQMFILRLKHTCNNLWDLELYRTANNTLFNVDLNLWRFQGFFKKRILLYPECVLFFLSIVNGSNVDVELKLLFT